MPINKPPIYSYRQSGTSLISLMIGLLISMVALLGMLSLYGNVVKSTVGSTRDARIAGERSIALLVASRQLQGAGYGIMNATRGNDLLLLKGAVIDEDNGVISGGTKVTDESAGHTLIWRTKSGGASWCSGLHAPSSGDKGGLYMLQPQRCGNVIDPNSWAIRPLLIDNSDAVDNRLPVTISIESGTCSAFRITGNGQVSISLRTEDRMGNEIISTTCLINFTSVTSGTGPS